MMKTLEQWVLARCAAVLFTSTLTHARYLAEYPAIESKSYLIYNGVDLDDFVGELRPGTQPTVAHVGTLHDFQWNQVQRFLEGFALELRTGGVPRNTQVAFVGAIGVALRTRLEKLLRQLEIGERVKILGFVPHGQAVHWMRTSQLLLLFAGEDTHYFRLSKISEYVVAGTPMLAFAPHQSQTAEEIRFYGGRVLADASEREVGVELARAFSTDAQSHRGPQMIEHPHPLNRRTEAQRLAEICFKVAEL
jgi:glycosyltransferase involved in cell wall biosynthesis